MGSTLVSEEMIGSHRLKHVNNCKNCIKEEDRLTESKGANWKCCLRWIYKRAGDDHSHNMVSLLYLCVLTTFPSFLYKFRLLLPPSQNTYHFHFFTYFTVYSKNIKNNHFLVRVNKNNNF